MMPEFLQSDTSACRARQLGALLRRAGVGPLRYDEPLSRHSSWRIGGRADLMIEPTSLESLAECCRLVARHQLPSVIIGHGTNLLFDDAGLNGVVVKIGDRMANWHVQGNRIWTQAGLWVPRLARIALRSGMTGIEHVVGIPGTVGGLVAMNGGSLRRSIGENVVSVRGIERATGAILNLGRGSCGFGYRRSRFQQGDLAVGEIQLECDRGEPPLMRREMLRILRDRRCKFPRKQPNCGSVFESGGEMYRRFGPPGKVIEEAGYKGLRVGEAQVSCAHANFIVNLGGASSRDVLELIHHIRTEVHKRTAIWMESEVRYVSPKGQVLPATESLR